MKRARLTDLEFYSKYEYTETPRRLSDETREQLLATYPVWHGPREQPMKDYHALLQAKAKLSERRGRSPQTLSDHEFG